MYDRRRTDEELAGLIRDEFAHAKKVQEERKRLQDAMRAAGFAREPLPDRQGGAHAA